MSGAAGSDVPAAEGSRSPEGTASVDTRRAYAASGVDVAAGERAVDLMRARVAATHGPEVLSGLGSFGAAVALPAGMREPVLVGATDGVGTKTALARSLRRFDTIGVDLVAMCADDVACEGARPLFFLDYVAAGHVVPLDVAALVEGVARGCEVAGCALVGGETAEHPGIMEPDEFDLAGFCVGVAERGELFDRSALQAGDALLGIASTGLHANGFSLVRQQLAAWDLDPGAPYLDVVRRMLGDVAAGRLGAEEPEHVLATLGEVLLTPSRIYARDVLGLRDALAGRGQPLLGLAHITGGGLPGNLPRAVPDGLAVECWLGSWPVPSVFRVMAALGRIDGPELRATFNCGIGMAAVVRHEGVDAALGWLASRGLRAWRIGRLVPAGAAAGTGAGASLREMAAPRYIEVEVEAEVR